MYSLYDRVTGSALYLLTKVIQHTCRKHLVGMEHFHQAVDSGRPVILAGWHGRSYMVISCLLPYADASKFSVLMPDDWRGGTLAVLTAKLGAIPFPMNMSGDPSLGMGRELVKVVRCIVEGGSTFIAPDGPDGPAYVAKPGITYIARKANAIIVPFGGYCRHAIRLNRWDSYVIPYPFSRVSIHIGKPMSIERDQDDLKAMDERLTDMLHRVTAQAEANYYVHRPS